MPRRISINSLLLVFALISVMPLVGALAYSSYAAWQAQEATVRASNSRAVEIVAAQTERFVAERREVLIELSKRPMIRAMDPQHCDPFLHDILSLNSDLSTVMTVNTKGVLVCSAVPPIDANVSFSDRDWWRELSATESFVVSGPVMGRVTGRWVSVFAQPVHSEDGTLVGAVAFPLDLLSYQPVLVQPTGSNDTNIRIIDDQGTIVASSEKPEEWVGKSFPDNETVKTVLASESGQAQTSGLDGIERLNSFSTIPSARWHVWIGVPVEVAFAEARNNATRSALISVILLVGSVGFAYNVSRRFTHPLRKLGQLARSVARGDRGVRASLDGPEEVALVAQSFNIMLAAQQKVEDDLKQSEAVFKKAFEASPDALLLRRLRDNIMLDVNPAFERITGYSRQEALSNPDLLFQLLESADYQGLVPALMEEDQPVVNYPVRFRTRSGELREALITAEKLEVRGEPCLLAIGRDVTDVKRAERERAAARAAEEANKAKNEFLSRMSHEMRTPLNAVLGFTELLEMEDPTARQYESLQHIRKAGGHLLKLVNEVLDIARIEAGQLQLSHEPVPVYEVVQECTDLIRPLAAQSKVDLQIAGDGSSRKDNHAPQEADAWVLADRLKLRQSLLNLISNAVKYNRPGGRVAISTHYTGHGLIRISVDDTGPGIPEEGLLRLFRPFERLGTTAREVEGTGLGLALSKLLVEAMGGQIGVESRPGKGSTFWIELPRVSMASSRNGLAPHSAELMGGMVIHPAPAQAAGTLLYIEDNPSNLKLVEGVVAHRPGVRLISAATGGEGLQILREKVPDLLLLDLNLPDMSGEEVLDRIRQNSDLEGVPVVVVSADANPAHIESLQKQGVHSYVTKPVDVQKLLSLIDSLLARSHAPRT